MPKVSIIIPIYNKYQYLNNLWDMLLNQSYKDYECLLVDDGSTDGSERLCDEIVCKDNRFKVFHIKNGGVSRARNYGLDKAQGQYITFIDADDGIHKDFIKNLIDDITLYNVDLVIGTLVKVWEDTDKKQIIKLPYEGKYELKNIINEFAKVQIETGIYGFCCGKLLSRELIGKHRFNENIKLAEDLDFCISLYPKVEYIYFDHKEQYYYLQQAVNSSMQKTDDEIDYYTQLCIQLKIYYFLEKMGGLSAQSLILMTNRLYDYVFFTLFHMSICDIKKYCKKIRKLKLPKVIDMKSRTWRFKWIVGLYLFGLDDLLIISRKIYSFFKSLKYKRKG